MHNLENFVDDSIHTQTTHIILYPKSSYNIGNGKRSNMSLVTQREVLLQIYEKCNLIQEIYCNGRIKQHNIKKSNFQTLRLLFVLKLFSFGCKIAFQFNYKVDYFDRLWIIKIRRKNGFTREATFWSRPALLPELLVTHDLRDSHVTHACGR